MKQLKRQNVKAPFRVALATAMTAICAVRERSCAAWMAGGLLAQKSSAMGERGQYSLICVPVYCCEMRSIVSEEMQMDLTGVLISGTIVPDMGTRKTSADIAAVLFGSVRRRVLGLLFTSPDRSYYLREIARTVDAGVGAVQREVAQLAGCGLLTRTRRGNQVHYQANAGSPVFAELRGLVLKTVGLADVLAEALAPVADQIEVAFVFGSMAEGTYRGQSDVDLLVIGEAGLLVLSPLLADAQLQLGRDINPSTISPAELRKRLADGDHFISAVLAGPRIYVIGGDDELTAVAR